MIRECELCGEHGAGVVELSTGLVVHPACFWDSQRLTIHWVNRRFAGNTNGRRW